MVSPLSGTSDQSRWPALDDRNYFKPEIMDVLVKNDWGMVMMLAEATSPMQLECVSNAQGKTEGRTVLHILAYGRPSTATGLYKEVVDLLIHKATLGVHWRRGAHFQKSQPQT